MQETSSIFTPENIRSMIGRRVLVDSGDNPQCYTIEDVSEMGEAAFIKPESAAVLDEDWVVLEWLNRWFLDFVAPKKKVVSSASPIDELMEGFFENMDRLKIGTIRETIGAAGIEPLTTRFAFSVDGKEHTAETIHEIFERRFGVPFRLI